MSGAVRQDARVEILRCAQDDIVPHRAAGSTRSGPASLLRKGI
jgi:hypothetical protein